MSRRRFCRTTADSSGVGPAGFACLVNSATTPSAMAAPTEPRPMARVNDDDMSHLDLDESADPERAQAEQNGSADHQADADTGRVERLQITRPGHEQISNEQERQRNEDPRGDP